MRPKILLIGGALNPVWRRTIEKFGEIHATTKDNLIKWLQDDLQQLKYYALIIIDATTDIVQLITNIRAKQSTIKIIVITASPNWRQARAVFQAGAQDYLSRSLPEKELQATLRSELS